MPDESHKERDARERRERAIRERGRGGRNRDGGSGGVGGGVARERIWPVWARNLAAMLETGAIVRFACSYCKRVYDVDVAALAILRGREWSLIGRAARCKASKCRAKGVFVAAPAMDSAFICLSGEMPRWLLGARPGEHEPPEGGPTDPDAPPPCPPGVDGVRWAYARDEGERRRLREGTTGQARARAGGAGGGGHDG